MSFIILPHLCVPTHFQGELKPLLSSPLAQRGPTEVLEVWTTRKGCLGGACFKSVCKEKPLDSQHLVIFIALCSFFSFWTQNCSFSLLCSLAQNWGIPPRPRCVWGTSYPVTCPYQYQNQVQYNFLLFWGVHVCIRASVNIGCSSSHVGNLHLVSPQCLWTVEELSDEQDKDCFCRPIGIVGKRQGCDWPMGRAHLMTMLLRLGTWETNTESLFCM